MTPRHLQGVAVVQRLEDGNVVCSVFVNDPRSNDNDRSANDRARDVAALLRVWNPGSDFDLESCTVEVRS